MDKKAKQILFKTYWSSSGWTENKVTPKEDYEYALFKGLMFNPIETDHNELCKSIRDNFKEEKKEEIVNGFISSLTTRNLRYRSFLSSYAVARVIENHNYITSNGRFCDICGVYGKTKQTFDLNALNFEKLKWGGVRLMHLEYIDFDLKESLNVDFPKPTKDDKILLQNLKDLILTSGFEDRPRLLEKRMSKLIKSNAYEREVILNIFGICGILETKNQKGFFQNYIPTSRREIRPVNKTDWSYPVDWWQGKYGINEKAWKYYFE